MKNWTSRLLWGEAGQEIMHPLADLGRRGGNEVTPQGFISSPRGQLSHTPRLSAGHEEHLQMKGFPRRRGEGGWVFARNVEILVRRLRRRLARSFRGGGWWQRLLWRS